MSTATRHTQGKYRMAYVGWDNWKIKRKCVSCERRIYFHGINSHVNGRRNDQWIRLMPAGAKHNVLDRATWPFHLFYRTLLWVIKREIGFEPKSQIEIHRAHNFMGGGCAMIVSQITVVRFELKNDSWHVSSFKISFDSLMSSWTI